MARIGIDASRAFVEKPTGVEIYSTELLKSLRNLKESENHNFILYHKGNLDNNYEFPPNFNLKKINGERFWTIFSLSKEMFLNSPDFLFVPSHTFPFFAPEPSAITIHDCGWKHFPESYPLKERIYLDQTTKIAVKKASIIFADSNFTKKDLMKFYGAKEEKVKVVYLGFQSSLRKESDKIIISETLKRFSIKTGSYITVVGRVDKKKNFEYALKSFNEVSKEFPDLKLVFVGSMGLGSDNFWDLAKKIGIAGKVVITNYITSRDLSIILSNSLFLFHPSLFEGFGMTILEAFHLGVPVCCSNTSSLPEIAGNSALYFDPFIIDDGVEKMRKLINDEKLRKTLVKEGEWQVKLFSWERCARETFEEIFKLL